MTFRRKNKIIFQETIFFNHTSLKKSFKIYVILFFPRSAWQKIYQSEEGKILFCFFLIFFGQKGQKITKIFF